MSFKNKIFFDKDISLDELKNKKVGIIGYGNQGRAQALNLNESGIDITVGLRENSNKQSKVKQDGLRCVLIKDLVSSCDLISILIPDSQIPGLFKSIAKLLKKDQTILFSHGYSVVNNEIEIPSYINVIMVAPSGGGAVVRSEYKKGFGVPALIAVEQDFSSSSMNLALSYSKAIGSTKAAVFISTFKEEVETDLFGEQADLCGGAASLIQNAFETLVNRGYQPEIAYFECLHELKLIVDLVQQYGLKGMYQRVSETARYGGLTRGDRVINKSSRDEMEKILDEIQSGQFAEEWRNIYNKEGKQSFDKYLDEIASHQIESTGKKLRDMMWPNKTNE